MDWKDVHDPTGEFDFAMEWTLVGTEYEAGEIQKMIKDSGVQDMVRTVNEHFKLISGHPVLKMGYVGDKKTVVQY